MRYLKISTAALLTVFLAASALPASASDDFDSWWRAKSGEIDVRWNMAAQREAGVPAPAACGRPTDAGPGEKPGMAPSPARRDSWTHVRSGPDWSGSMNANFTSHSRGDNLWRSTRERSGPSRGISTLENPSKATRASSAAKRLPFNNSARFRRTVGSGRAAAWRKRPKIGQRLRSGGSSARRRSSASSYTRGSTRMRGTARSAR